MTRPEDLQLVIREFLDSFESEAPVMVEAIQRRQAPEIRPSLGDDDPDVARAAAAVGVAIALSAMRMPSQASFAVPDATVREARAVAASGGSLSALLQGYRIGHAVIQEHMLLHAERQGTSLTAVRAMTERLFSHIDRLIRAAQHEFLDERRRRSADIDLTLHERVVRLLAGDEFALADGETDIGYQVDALHLAIVFGADVTADADHRLLDGLALPSLRVAAPGQEVWVWISLTDPGAEGDLRARLKAVCLSGTAGLGTPAWGGGGMAASHRQAGLACRLGALRGVPVSAYGDVALEALAFGGPEAARDFALAELGLLAADDERSATLRHTVQTYFATGGSAAATAASVGIAERTVTYRLRRAEELVGHPLSVRRAEIEAALRLHRVLDSGL